MSRFRNVAIVGAGQIGIGIAQVAAVSGHSVTLNTTEVNKTNKQIERNLKNDNKIRRMNSGDQKAAIANMLRFDQSKGAISSASEICRQFFDPFLFRLMSLPPHSKSPT